MKKKVKDLNPDLTINLALDTISIKKQALVFTNTKRSAEKTAEDISLKIKQTDKELQDLASKALKALPKPTRQCTRLAFCLKKGIAFHHAGLTHKQKELIEENFRKGLIKIICATPTLSYGLSMPAFRAIMKDLRRYGHRGLDWIPTLEYLQMAGRAGRPEWDSYGEAIAIAKTKPAAKEIKERYLKGEPEEILSKLAVEPVLRTYILSLIATDFVNTRTDLVKFFGKTFWAYQFQNMKELESKIMKMLHLLEEFEFIKSEEEKEEFQSAADIYNYTYKATPIGKRVAELYIDPLTADYIIQAVKRAGIQSKTDSSRKKSITPFSFLQVISSTLEIRPLLRVKVKEFDIIEDELLKQEDSLLTPAITQYDPDYDDFLNSIKTSMFFKDWINEKDEEYLLETYNIRPGEIRVKLEIANWLLYSASELTRMLNFKEIVRELIKLRLRIKNGVKEELLPLLRLKGIGRVRARKLFRIGIKDIRTVKKANITTLTQLLGKKTALNIKEQVGQKVNIVKKRARKGQTSISKY